MPTQQEYNVTKQNSRKLYSKFEILNYRFQIIDNLEGVVVGTPSFTNDSNSAIRRTCNIQIVPNSPSYDIEYNKKLFVNNYVKVYLGIYDDYNDEIIYTKMGIYLIDNPNKVYNATSNTISISGLDLMSKLTGIRGGNLEGLQHDIPQGTNVRNLLIETLKLFQFDKYVIKKFPILTPYDISISVGSNGYSIIEQIMNILPNWQAYFDLDGVFHFEPIPNGKNEQVRVNDDLWKDLLISYNIDYDYENIKNYIEVLGGVHEELDNCNVEALAGNTFILSHQSLENKDLVDGLMFGFKTPLKNKPNKDSPIYVKIDSVDIKQLKNEDGTTPNLDYNTFYTFKYIKNGDYYQFLGGIQPYAISYEGNPNSPFYINKQSNQNKIYRIVLSGGEYDNINSDYLAKQRADFELYQRCRLQDSVTITCVPIYWIDTNWLIEITLPNKQSKEETNKYIIKSINTTFGINGTQNITMMRYYPYYPSV